MKAILLLFLLASLPPQAQVEEAIPVAWAIVRYFPAEQQRWALRTAYCENRTFDPEAISPTGDWGVLQVHLDSHRDRLARLGLEPADLLTVDANVMVAADIWRERGRQPWTTRWAC